MLFEAVGDVFEENQPEDDVLVLRSVHIVAEFVGGQPELGFKAKVSGCRVRFLCFCGSGHSALRTVYPKG
jgi:hypothetical protein